MRIGDEIIIEGKRFRVTGVLRTFGNRQDDSMIYLDLEHFQQVTGIREGANFAAVKINENFNLHTVGNPEYERVRALTQSIADYCASNITPTSSAMMFIRFALNEIRYTSLVAITDFCINIIGENEFAFSIELSLLELNEIGMILSRI